MNGSVNSVNIQITGNQASDGSVAIYGGAIQCCQVEGTIQRQMGYQVLQKISTKYKTCLLTFIYSKLVIANMAHSLDP